MACYCKGVSKRGWVFQEDNGPVHVSRQTIHWKTENNIETLPWPSQSPDINIIENVWRTIKVQLGKRLSEIQSQKDLINVVLDIWSSLDQASIRLTFKITDCAEGKGGNNQVLKKVSPIFVLC